MLNYGDYLNATMGVEENQLKMRWSDEQMMQRQRIDVATEVGARGIVDKGQTVVDVGSSHCDVWE